MSRRRKKSPPRARRSSANGMPSRNTPGAASGRAIRHGAGSRRKWPPPKSKWNKNDRCRNSRKAGGVPAANQRAQLQSPQGGSNPRRVDSTLARQRRRARSAARGRALKTGFAGSRLPHDRHAGRIKPHPPAAWRKSRPGASQRAGVNDTRQRQKPPKSTYLCESGKMLDSSSFSAFSS